MPAGCACRQAGESACGPRAVTRMCRAHMCEREREEQPNDSDSDEDKDGRRPAVAAAAARESTTGKRKRNGPADGSGTQQQEREDQEDDDRSIPFRHQTAVPLSRSREKRALSPVVRLGVVQEKPRRRQGETRKRKPPDLEIHMERAGTHGGELKHLIRAGQMLMRRIEGEAKGDG